jgi:hypothetical protein
MKKLLIISVFSLVLLPMAAMADYSFTLDSSHLSEELSGSGHNGDTGNDLAALATFTLDPSAHGGTLTIILSNTQSSGGKVQPSDILTGLVWTSATALSTNYGGSSPWGALADYVYRGKNNDVGMSYQYLNFNSTKDSSGQSFNRGFSAVGRGIWSANDKGNFPSANSKQKLSNINYGLAPAYYDGTNGNPSVNSSQLSFSDITFILYGAGNSIEISDVIALYGSSGKEPALLLSSNAVATPIPTSLLLFGSGFLGLAGLRKRV